MLKAERKKWAGKVSLSVTLMVYRIDHTYVSHLSMSVTVILQDGDYEVKMCMVPTLVWQNFMK